MRQRTHRARGPCSADGAILACSFVGWRATARLTCPGTAADDADRGDQKHGSDVHDAAGLFESDAIAGGPQGARANREQDECRDDDPDGRIARGRADRR